MRGRALPVLRRKPVGEILSQVVVYYYNFPGQDDSIISCSISLFIVVNLVWPVALVLTFVSSVRYLYPLAYGRKNDLGVNGGVLHVAKGARAKFLSHVYANNVGLEATDSTGDGGCIYNNVSYTIVIEKD